MKSTRYRRFSPVRAQRGLTTLIMALLLLGILSIVVLFATSVGVFDQRTTTNENRAKLAEASAEAGLNLAGEFFKANLARINEDEDAGGWLVAASLRWVPCSTAGPTGQVDPCEAERDATRRAAMYRYQFNGSTNVDYAAIMPAGAQLTAVSLGNATTPMTVNVSATMCRMDMSDPANPVCALEPADEDNRIAVTLVSNAAIVGESAAAEVKETLATYRMIGGAATVPLVASGTVMGLGNAQLVANPNAGGWGVPASIWSPCPVDIESGTSGAVDPLCPAVGGGGIGSVITCHVGEFLEGRPITDLLTHCPFNNDCGCPGLGAGGLSGHSGSETRESIDILDVDGGEGELPDITYFPREPWDDPADPLDDSLFEVIFNADVVAEGATNVSTTCTGPAEYGGDCAKIALHDLGAEKIPDCTGLSASSTGLFWNNTGGCSISGQVGSPEAPVVLVIEGDLQLNANGIIFGMLYLRSSDSTAELKATGSPQIYGMAIVEGTVDMGGTPSIVFSAEIANAINSSPAFTRFGRVPGSWLDARSGF